MSGSFSELNYDPGQLSGVFLKFVRDCVERKTIGLPFVIYVAIVREGRNMAAVLIQSAFDGMVSRSISFEFS